MYVKKIFARALSFARASSSSVFFLLKQSRETDSRRATDYFVQMSHWTSLGFSRTSWKDFSPRTVTILVVVVDVVVVVVVDVVDVVVWS